MKKLEEKVAPELLAALESMSPIMEDGLSLEELQTLWMGSIDKSQIEHSTDEIAIYDQTVATSEQASPVLVRIYHPLNAKNQAAMPCVLWIHGGGFIAGSVYHSDRFCKNLALACECIVVSVEYRLAPQHSHPAAIDDCYEALLWLASEETSLPVDTCRIAVAGISGGGCLTAGVVLRARDQNGPAINLQAMIVPALDHRCDSPSYTMSDPRVLNRDKTRRLWDAYIGGNGKDVPIYASPALAEDLSGLPPTWVSVAENDTLRDEAITYAQRLMQADVSTDLRVYRGSFHGALTLAPEAPVNQSLVDDLYSTIRRSFSV